LCVHLIDSFVLIISIIDIGINDAPMSDSLVSDDLHISPLPLTQKHRDELDAAVLENVEGILVTASDSTCFAILTMTIIHANRLLERENMKVKLDEEMVAYTKPTFQQHPKLWDIVNATRQSRHFASIADLSKHFYY
jgi:hypothetical protein